MTAPADGDGGAAGTALTKVSQSVVGLPNEQPRMANSIVRHFPTPSLEHASPHFHRMDLGNAKRVKAQHSTKREKRNA